MSKYIQFYILSLKRRFDRTLTGVSGMVAAGIPFHQIHVHYGRDGAEYESPQHMLDEMDKAYPGLDKMQARLVDELDATSWGRGDLGCLWSTLECLDAFIESDHEIGYFSQDDRCIPSNALAKEYEYYKDPRASFDLQHQVDWLLNYDPDMKVFHIYHRSFHDYSIKKLKESVRVSENMPIAHGIMTSGDSGIVFSKQGAIELKDMILAEQRFLEHCLPYITETENYYHSLTPHRWTTDTDARIFYYGFIEGDIQTPIEPEGPLATAVQDRVILNYQDFSEGHSDYIAPYEKGSVEQYISHSDQYIHKDNINIEVKKRLENMDRVVLVTGQNLLDYSPNNKPQPGVTGGGVAVKTWFVQQANKSIKCVTPSKLEELSASIIIMEALAMHQGTDAEDPFAANLERIDKATGYKILWIEEQEFLRWTGGQQSSIQDAFDCIAVSNLYLQRQLAPYIKRNIETIILPTPIDEAMFRPDKKDRIITGAGQISIRKNTPMLVDIFRNIGSQTDFKSVYMGNSGLWGDDANSVDKSLENDVELSVDKYIYAADLFEVAERLNKSLYYVNCNLYDVGSLTFLQAGLSGCHCLLWKYHPMFDEYQNVERPNTVDDFVNIIKESDKTEPNLELRQEIMDKHSFIAFNKQLRNLIGDILLSC